MTLHGTGAGEDFSVLSLNLRFGLANDGKNAWRHRKHAVFEVLEKHPADFYLFQEVNDFQAEDLSRSLGGCSIIGLRRPAPPFWQNLVIFYSTAWRLVFQERFFLTDTPEIPSRFPESRWPRQCTAGIFEKKGRRILMANTHLDFSDTVQVRAAQVILDRFNSSPARHADILSGDFNASPDTPVHRLLTGAGGFTDATPQRGTHHRFTGVPADESPIDWILFKGEIRLLTHRIITDAPGGVYPSDHFPLKARFAWAENP